MSKTTSPVRAQLAALASRLGARRNAILQAWRRAVDGDPLSESGAKLSRAQFFDHIPEVLDSFEHLLSTATEQEDPATERENRDLAAEHGRVRWQQGYQLPEVMHDWGHLHLCLLQELESDAARQRDVPIEVMSIARVRLTQLCNEGISQSAMEYAQLQQAEASGRLTALERALGKLQELEQQRAETWREAAHDLRGNFGVVKNVTAALNQQGLPHASRDQLQAMLKEASIHCICCSTIWSTLRDWRRVTSKDT